MLNNGGKNRKEIKESCPFICVQIGVKLHWQRWREKGARKIRQNCPYCSLGWKLHRTFAHRFIINIHHEKTHQGFDSNTHYSYYSLSLLRNFEHGDNGKLFLSIIYFYIWSNENDQVFILKIIIAYRSDFSPYIYYRCLGLLHIRLCCR